MNRLCRASLVGCLLLCGLLAGCGGMHADAKKDSTDLPVAKSAAPPQLAVNETSYDFGEMGEGDKGAHVFEVRNEGTGPLDLRFVKTSCGCTSVRIGELEWNPKAGDPPTDIVSVPPGGTIGI